MSEVRRVRRKRKKLRFGKVANRNLKITSWVIIGFLFILCIRIIYINVAYGDEYSIAVLKQQSFTNNIVPYKRGDIKDRNGNILATSTVVYNMVVDAKMLSKESSHMKSVSSTNCSRQHTTLFVPIFTPLSTSVLKACLTIPARPSATTKNRKGPRGHPVSTP